MHVASAGLGAMASACVRVPADTLKHRVQAYRHPNVFAAAGSICASPAGWRGLYSGFVPTILRDIPEIAIQFAAYDSLRCCVQRRRGDGDAGSGGAPAAPAKLQTWEHLTLGGASGALAAVATCPLDVLKTRLQTGGSAGQPARGVLAATLRQHGVAGLFAGLVRGVGAVLRGTLQGSRLQDLFKSWIRNLR